MILILPLRLMTLHFSQIGFTDDLTFMAILLSSVCRLYISAAIRYTGTAGNLFWTNFTQHINKVAIIV